MFYDFFICFENYDYLQKKNWFFKHIENQQVNENIYFALLNWWRKKFNNQMPKIWNTKPNTITKDVRVCDQIHGAQSKYIKSNDQNT